MNAQPPGSYTRLAIAIVVAALIIGSAIFLVTLQTVRTITVTSSVNLSCDSSPTLHCVVFQQLGACSPEFWGVPWSVTVDGITHVQPVGAPPPGPDAGLGGTLNKNLT